MSASGDGNGLGAWGGSLGYTCSNSNPPYNGLTGGYVAVGIDEYGNFLNGITNTLGETGTSASGDNTASGGGYQPGRIGMRGAGNVSWLTLNGAYGGATNPGAAKPWYPDSLATSCAQCRRHLQLRHQECSNCSNGGTYNSGTQFLFDHKLRDRHVQRQRQRLRVLQHRHLRLAPATSARICPTQLRPTTPAPDNATIGAPRPSPTTDTPPRARRKRARSARRQPGLLLRRAEHLPQRPAVQLRHCQQPGERRERPSSRNAVNTGNATATPAIAPILDYTAIPNAYVVLPSTVQIANESAMKRADATPIFYQLKISQNGLLSLAYSTCPPGSSSGCSAFTSVITKQNITTSNGPLPANFLFGFAGSTGGANNIHEILCFRADPATSASSSAGASEKQSAKLENGIQAYFAYYNPSNGWTGRVTASSLGFDGFGNVVIDSYA